MFVFVSAYVKILIPPGKEHSFVNPTRINRRWKGVIKQTQNVNQQLSNIFDFN